MQNSLLLIHSSLPTGGIETFFLRLATERHRRNERTKILLMKGRVSCDPDILRRIGIVAEIFFLDDLLGSKISAAKLHPYLFPISSIDRVSAAKLLDGVDFVHTTDARGLYLADQILRTCSVKLPVTVGIYHSKEFTWDYNFIPFFEKENRKLFQHCADLGGIVFFNDRIPQLYNDYGYSIDKYNLFPIGVVSINKPVATEIDRFSNFKKKKIRIVSVGRLHPFKSYNYWMPLLVKSLTSKGIDVSYDIFGSGPMRDELDAVVKKLGLRGQVNLMGDLEYERFSQVVQNYDLCVGSGTAIVEAASLGVPSIVAIESERRPLTYGFFSQIEGFTYHEDGIAEKTDVGSHIDTLMRLEKEELDILCKAHIEKAKIFSMESCASNFAQLPSSVADVFVEPSRGGMLSRLRYVLSFFSFCAFLKLVGTSHGKVRYGA